MRNLTMAVTASLVGLAFTSVARADAPELMPPTTSVDASAGAHGEETYFPGPGGGELETQGPPPLESTGLEDGPGSCKCATALGSRSNPGAVWVSLALGMVGAARRRRAK